MSSRNLKDLTGRAFGRWTVLRRKEPKSAWPVRDALTLPIKRKNSRHETTSCI